MPHSYSTPCFLMYDRGNLHRCISQIQRTGEGETVTLGREVSLGLAPLLFFCFFVTIESNTTPVILPKWNLLPALYTLFIYLNSPEILVRISYIWQNLTISNSKKAQRRLICFFPPKLLGTRYQLSTAEKNG